MKGSFADHYSSDKMIYSWIVKNNYKARVFHLSNSVFQGFSLRVEMQWF